VFLLEYNVLPLEETAKPTSLKRGSQTCLLAPLRALSWLTA
jgi:hypothetical protein